LGRGRGRQVRLFLGAFEHRSRSHLRVAARRTVSGLSRRRLVGIPRARARRDRGPSSDQEKTMTERWLSGAVSLDTDPPTERRLGSEAPLSGRSDRRPRNRGSEAPVSRTVVQEREIGLDDFRRYFPYTPTALAIKECARLSVVRRHPCPGPVLDVGCGDGLFARIAFDSVEVWGIDIDAAEGRWAAASQAYRQVSLGDVTDAQLHEPC